MIYILHVQIEEEKWKKEQKQGHAGERKGPFLLLTTRHSGEDPPVAEDISLQLTSVFSHPHASFISQDLFLQPSHILPIIPIIIPFHGLLHGFRLLALPFPFGLTHLAFAPEELLVGLAVGASQAIPKRGELAVIVIKVKMMHCVAGGTVDDRGIGDVFAII